jgi:hypothetical protein
MSVAQDIIDHVRDVTDRNHSSHDVPDTCPMCLTVDRFGAYLWFGSGRARHCQHCGTVWSALATNSTDTGREHASQRHGAAKDKS